MTPDHETHIRNDQTRRNNTIKICIAALPNLTDLGNAGYCTEAGISVLSMARKSLTALLSPDQRDASEPLSSAQPYVAPVDRGPGADAMAETGKTYEQGLRDALEALPIATSSNGNIYRDRAVKAIEALLPARDPVKALADSIASDTEAMDRNYADGFMEACRRLLSAGRIAK